MNTSKGFIYVQTGRLTICECYLRTLIIVSCAFIYIEAFEKGIDHFLFVQRKNIHYKFGKYFTDLQSLTTMTYFMIMKSVWAYMMCLKNGCADMIDDVNGL